MDKRNVVVYPYDSWFTPILRHKSLINNYDIIGLASPNGWGLNGLDAGAADNAGNIGLTVGKKLEDFFESCDTVLFTQSEKSLDFKIIYSNIVKAIEAKKDIICNIDLPLETAEEISHLCLNKGVTFNYTHLKKHMDWSDLKFESERVYSPDTPTVFVLGLGEKTQKFEIQLALREHLLAVGYKVSQIGSRNNCELLGFHSFPSFMFNNSVSESNKIIMFNRFVKKIEAEEKPDIIIIGVPGGIMPFNSKFTNRFGVLAFEIAQAVTPDTAVFSTLYEDFRPEYFIGLAKSVRYKLGLEIGCYNIANYKFDAILSKELGSMEYISLDLKTVEEKKNQLGMLETPVFNILNSADPKKMTDFIIDKLAKNAEVESL